MGERLNWSVAGKVTVFYCGLNEGIKNKREKTDGRRELLPNREHAVRHVGDINIIGRI
jgi:hypothetical protein